MSGPDVVVAGGGPIGLASAWRAAQAGLAVTVCDPAPGGGAADVAAGMLAAVTEAWFGEDELVALGVASARRWPAFAAELDGDGQASTGFVPGRTLLVAFDADDAAAVGRVADLYDELGLDAKRLRGRELRDLEPALSPRIRGGLIAGGDHRVDPRALCATLVERCEDAGVEIRRQRVRHIDTRGGRVGGVVLDDGTTIRSPRVVLAAGAWSRQIEGLDPHHSPPVRPVKGEVVTLGRRNGQPPILEHTVRAQVKGAALYLVPRHDGRVVIGATVQERGYDTTVTAGGVYELLRDATVLVPGIDELELVEARSSLRPGTPDNAPIIGESELPGLVVATGHFRNGILLTPITADAVAAILAGTEPPPEITCCHPGRFA